ncbi:endonuclease MutS2 [Listeria costaricensis]|uniref:endonuclease MutS2 n=1 Tax=Listeria costaricensis TaxID=2026604 RepID=UPI000C07120B|nr:mannonate oxidoreductase [Listeria costaricensis]
MNEKTMTTLEFDRIIEQLTAHVYSDRGREAARNVRPLSNWAAIQQKLNETEEAKRILDSGQKLPLTAAGEIQSIFNKLQKEFILEPNEFQQVADFLRSAGRIKRFLQKNQSMAHDLANYSAALEEFPELEQLIDRSIRNGQVADEASSTLRKIRQAANACEAKLTERLHKFIRNRTNQPMLQDFFITKKNDRYTVPVKASYKKQIRGTIIEENGRGTTVFIEPEAVSKLNDEWQALKVSEQNEVYQIQALLSGEIMAEIEPILENLAMIAEFDLIFARGQLAREMDATRPIVNEAEQIVLHRARHPFIAREMAVPLDFQLGETFRGLIITGPNAGGKTVVLKTVGLLTLMALSGLFIPAAEGSKIAFLKELFVDIGDDQSIDNALSTFSSHMANIARIEKQLSRPCLLLFDEIGSGTEPNEGAALAKAILESCYEKGALIVATTHYEAIKQFGKAHPDFKNAAMAFTKETLVPKYQLLLDRSGASHALFIAKKMQLNEAVVKKAAYYMEHTSTDFQKKQFPEMKPASSLKQEISTYQRGDKVELLDTKETALVYEPKMQNGQITVFRDGRSLQVQAKRTRLLFSASELYPPDYDLRQLFESYESRKEEHDFERGSKKALRKVQKEIDSRKHL